VGETLSPLVEYSGKILRRRKSTHLRNLRMEKDNSAAVPACKGAIYDKLYRALAGNFFKQNEKW